MDGEEYFKKLWILLHNNDGWITLPCSADNLRSMMEWMVENMDKSLLTKLGLNDITKLSEKAVEGKIAIDQQRRTIERKKQQKKYGKKAGKKKQPESM